MKGLNGPCPSSIIYGKVAAPGLQQTVPTMQQYQLITPEFNAATNHIRELLLTLLGLVVSGGTCREPLKLTARSNGPQDGWKGLLHLLNLGRMLLQLPKLFEVMYPQTSSRNGYLIDCVDKTLVLERNVLEKDVLQKRITLQLL